jgi:hypothetical protein
MSAAPDFLTVEEAIKVIRVGRTVGYRLAGKSKGIADEEFPVARFGKQLRVPRVRLEHILGGPLTWPPIDVDAEADPAPVTPPPRTQRRTRSSTPAHLQAVLPLDE